MIQFSFNDGPQIPLLAGGNVLRVGTNPTGESMPPLHLIVSGALTVNASAFSHDGTLIVHPFRAIVDCPDCCAVLEICADPKGKARGADGTQAATATFLSHGAPGRATPYGEGEWVEVSGKPDALAKGPTVLHTCHADEWTPNYAKEMLNELTRAGVVELSAQRITVKNL